eukprot:15471911-Alexandrium_andersonii.AAC.1
MLAVSCALAQLRLSQSSYFSYSPRRLALVRSLSKRHTALLRQGTHHRQTSRATFKDRSTRASCLLECLNPTCDQ